MLGSWQRRAAEKSSNLSRLTGFYCHWCQDMIWRVCLDLWLRDARDGPIENRRVMLLHLKHSLLFVDADGGVEIGSETCFYSLLLLPSRSQVAGSRRIGFRFANLSTEESIPLHSRKDQAEVQIEEGGSQEVRCTNNC
jgi:hypothetical protein